MSEKQYRPLEGREIIEPGDEQKLRDEGEDQWRVTEFVGDGVVAWLGWEFRRPVDLIPPTPTPPDLEEYRAAQTEAEGWITNMNKAQTIDFVASHIIELSQLRAENERLKLLAEKNHADAQRYLNALTASEREIVELKARAALSGSAEKGGG